MKEQNGNTNVPHPCSLRSFLRTLTQMKFTLIFTFLLITLHGFAQSDTQANGAKLNKGTITETLTYKDLNNESLPYQVLVPI